MIQNLDRQFVDAVRPDASSWVRFDATSLHFDPATPFEVWEEITQRLIEVNRGIQWWVADALAFGEAAYGERYSQVLETDFYSYDTLRNMAWVSRSIEPSRRRDAVPFSHHTEVAPLQADDQQAFLAMCEDEGINRQDLRERVQKHRRARAREAALAAPVPHDDLLPLNVEFSIADATRLPLDNEKTDLIVTSPPYGLDKPYRGVRDPAEGWQAFMTDWLKEASRVSRAGGRLALNVPLDTTKGGFRPTAAQSVTAAEEAGWTYRSTIVWNEGTVSKSVARGSVDSPSAPHIIAPVEVVLLFSKGKWKRIAKGRAWDLTHDEWLEWTNGLWTFPGENNPWEGFEAAYPVELPYRLIKLLSFYDDVVCDPFLGSGTTAVAATRLGRPFVGYDISEIQVDSAKRRLASATNLIMRHPE
jgi:site-specific DNA-methyltransferase (adenine-specific)